ncbi:MAG TPA: hypothetical protein VFC36_06915 [Paludibacter sp.]|nr:hypothetical protein [Paludibacter sp.]
MTNKETIGKINGELRYGDKKRIANEMQLHVVTINSFFNGKEEKLIEDTQTRIMSAALKIIEERQKRARSIEKKTNDLLG